MARKVVAIVGSYRKGGTVDTTVDAVLEGARENGAETVKICLIDRRIEYCRNCRECTQAAGKRRGQCGIADDMQAILREVDSADAVVLGSPVNFFNVTAVFRTFLERLVGCVYWPWGQAAPKPRTKAHARKAVLVASMAAPRMLMPLATGAPRALKMAAECLGAKTVAKLWIGLAAQDAEAKVPERVLRKARKVGAEL